MKVLGNVKRASLLHCGITYRC